MIEQDFLDLGLKPDNSRIWNNRMCFKIKRLRLDYHIPTSVLIIKKPSKKKCIVTYKVLYKGVVKDSIDLKNILDEIYKITN